MSRVLLIESPYSYGKDHVLVGKYFPLGIGYLAAYLRSHDHTVKIFQPTTDANYYAELFSLIKDFGPNIVGISVMTPTYFNAHIICKTIKERFNDCWTVLGGHHVSAVGVDVMEESSTADFAVIGEGELTLLELVRELETAKPKFEKIDGLIWRNKEGDVVINRPRQLIEDIDNLPFPDRSMVDISKYRLHSYIDFGKKSATMITSRGCPFKCMFCSSWLTMGDHYRYRSVDNVMSEIKEIVENYGIDHIVFEDDTMTLKRDRIEAICDGLIQMPQKPTWYCLSRVDSMDYDLAKLMKKAGCRMVNFGIESGSSEILKKIGKRISVSKAIEVIRACHKAGLRTQCTFILGFPYDTMETMKMTLDAAKKIGPTIAIFFPLTPYPGTEVYEKFLDKDLMRKNVEDWNNFTMTYNTSGISVNDKYSGKEIRDLAYLWNRKFYLRPKQLIKLAKTVNSVESFIRLAQGGLYLISTYLRK